MTTIMETEAREAPARIAEQLAANAKAAEKIGARLRELSPHMVLTVGRGSSDHAGMFGKYLIEVEAGVPVASAAPSVVSIYKNKLKLKNALVLVISQSGRSPDILAQARMAKEAGAFCVALVNDESSPVSEIVDAVLPLKAGTEKAVAATKSYLATLAGLSQLVAQWTLNKPLQDGLAALPDMLKATQNMPAQLLPAALKEINNCIVLGRGFGFAVSLEIALKLKEVCGIQAEAFSSAEFLHGPVTLAERKLTVLDVTVQDESTASHREQVENVKQRGASIIHMGQAPANMHPRLIPLAIMQRFYLDVEKIALSRGVNPDAPPGLKKVTQTL
jgi:glucosamine--fructose-6-phosphate aminotransferase (isomerizing)